MRQRLVDNFDAAFVWLLHDEGTEFTDDPVNGGRATKFGITVHSLAEWKGCATADDVKALTIEEAQSFYREMYWQPLLLDECISSPVAICIFDLSVLIGRRRGTIAAQTAAGAKQDGVMGPLTMAAINATSPTLFVADMTAWAATLLIRNTQETPSQGRFLIGWMTRCFRLFRLAAQPG